MWSAVKPKKVFVDADDAGIAVGVNMEDKVFESSGFLSALDIMVRPGGLGGSISKHYHDYAKIVTIG